MKMLNKWALVFCLALAPLFFPPLQAQNQDESVLVEANAEPAQQIEMADRMRQEGKIYVVVGCVLVVLAGMIVYLVSIDKKVSRLEKQYKD
ncbi:MAG: CcmD family protein [Adhaeribacter sp.]